MLMRSRASYSRAVEFPWASVTLRKFLFGSSVKAVVPPRGSVVAANPFSAS